MIKNIVHQNLEGGTCLLCPSMDPPLPHAAWLPVWSNTMIFFINFNFHIMHQNNSLIDLMHWRHKGSHLHNNDASLVSRSAHVLCWQCALALSLSVRGPGRASPAVWLTGFAPLAACLAMTHVAVFRLTPNAAAGRPSVMSYAYGLYCAQKCTNRHKKLCTPKVCSLDVEITLILVQLWILKNYTQRCQFCVFTNKQWCWTLTLNIWNVLREHFFRVCVRILHHCSKAFKD